MESAPTSNNEMEKLKTENKKLKDFFLKYDTEFCPVFV